MKELKKKQKALRVRSELQLRSLRGNSAMRGAHHFAPTSINRAIRLTLEYHALLHFCVPYGSHNKQRLFPQTAVTGWALLSRRNVFPVRYELNL
jgi:hypothetical protein